MLCPMAVKPTNQAQPSPVSAYLINTRPPDRTPVRPITPITARPPAQKPPTQTEPAQIELEKHEGQSAALEIMSFYKRPSDKAASARPSAIGRRLDVVG